MGSTLKYSPSAFFFAERYSPEKLALGANGSINLPYLRTEKCTTITVVSDFFHNFTTIIAIPQIRGVRNNDLDSKNKPQ